MRIGDSGFVGDPDDRDEGRWYARYVGASALGGGISGALSSTDACLEGGRIPSAGWYVRWSGLGGRLEDGSGRTVVSLSLLLKRTLADLELRAVGPGLFEMSLSTSRSRLLRSLSLYVGDG